MIQSGNKVRWTKLTSRASYEGANFFYFWDIGATFVSPTTAQITLIVDGGKQKVTRSARNDELLFSSQGIEADFEKHSKYGLWWAKHCRHAIVSSEFDDEDEWDDTDDTDEDWDDDRNELRETGHPVQLNLPFPDGVFSGLNLIVEGVANIDGRLRLNVTVDDGKAGAMLGAVSSLKDLSELPDLISVHSANSGNYYTLRFRATKYLVASADNAELESEDVTQDAPTNNVNHPNKTDMSD
jgi:hypothetical protein